METNEEQMASGHPSRRLRGLRAFAVTTSVAAVIPMTAGVVLALSEGSAVAHTSYASVNAGGGKEHRVTICHRTDSETNPYVRITVDVHSVDGDTTNDHGKGDHLAEHTGDVWYPGHPKEPKWGDIIPPFYADGTSDGLPSLNWNDAGQLIFNNGCNPVTETTPTSPTSSPPTSNPTTPPPTTQPTSPPTTKPTTPTPPPTTNTTQGPPPSHPTHKPPHHHGGPPAPPPSPSQPQHFGDHGLITAAPANPYQSGSQLPLELVMFGAIVGLGSVAVWRLVYLESRKDRA